MHFETFSADRSETIWQRLQGGRHRILVFGEMGIGKSTLVTELAQELTRTGTDHLVIGADPGSPAYGIPGAVCAGRWRGDGFDLLAYEALCSLNAGRFRLPLTHAVARLLTAVDVPLLLIDAPGVTRGVAGAELLTGLIDAAAVDTVLLMVGEGKTPPMVSELKASGVDILRITASGKAKPPSRRRRIEQRTRLWDAHLNGVPETRIPLDAYHHLGTPPPSPVKAQWRGRQIALLDRGYTKVMGEIVAAEEDILRVRLPEPLPAANQLLVRDAARSEEGVLTTRTPLHPPPSRSPIPSDCLPHRDHLLGPLAVVKLRRATAILVNGLFGDPLLHLRLQNRKRSLLFDLGEGGRLPARIAHQVGDIFISHAHLDHISGFLWLLRARIGAFAACRIYGPPGLARHIAGLMNGIHWDRIGNRGPVFEVFELHGDWLEGFRLQAGLKHGQLLGQTPAPDGRLVDDPAFTVRAVTLDHGIPVLALAFEQKPEYRVSRKALKTMGYPPGPWVGELKQQVAAGDAEGEIALPGGRTASSADLADKLIQMLPGEKLVYATDLADTPANRGKLIHLAGGAHTFFCEAAFLSAQARLAKASGHLTARACGEIAAQAGVRHLVPFHLSKRYAEKTAQVMDEVRSACPGIDVG